MSASTASTFSGLSYLAKLNPAQREAVEFGVGEKGTIAPGPLLVIAGAGSGKTNTLAHRVAHLIANGADPRAMLLLTFSRRAAAEMTRRVAHIIAGIEGPTGKLAELARSALTWSGTFHAMGARLLREYAERIGLPPSFTIHDREDSADLINLVRHELGFSAKDKRFPAKATCLAIYSMVVNTSAPLRDVLTTAYPWCATWEDDLKTLFAGYVAAKQREGVLDYDDLLLYWAQMMTEPSLAEELGARFEHVLVDEYQDTNRLQAMVLQALKPEGRGLTVVGDDAQSIYAFRGATVRNILDFPTQFDPPAKVITLDQNYRSTQPILAASNAVIGQASERFTKDLWTARNGGAAPQLITVRDEVDQARYIVKQILDKREHGLLLKTQAALFRASHHSATLEIELTRANIPYVKYGGLKFLEAAHVKDLLAVLRWIENPQDRVAGFRVMQLMPGIGPKTAAKALEAVSETKSLAVMLAAFSPPAQAAQAWAEFVQLVDHTQSAKSAWPADLERIRTWYEPHLQRRFEDNAEVRAADLAQLEKIAAGFPDRQRFLTELTLDPPDATSDESGAPMRDEDYFILSTIHSAKGQEWAAVFLLNAVDGCIPSDLATGNTEEIDEERRLLYVAMTRAKDHLDIITPQRFYTSQQAGGGDRHVYAIRTRFIPPELVHHFSAKGWPASVIPDASGPATAPPKRVIDLAAKMRDMWK